MKNKERFIGYDFQGWPEYKMTLREMLQDFVQPVDGKFIIDENDERLDICPRVLEDDGMGYGVNEQYITDYYIDEDKKICNIFIEKPMEKCKLWANTPFIPDMRVKLADKKSQINEYYEIKDINEENGEIIFDVEHYSPNGKETLKLKENEINFL